MFLKLHVGTQLSLLYQIRIPLLSVSTLLFSKNEYSQYLSFHAYKFILKPNGTPKIKFKGKGLTPMSVSNPAYSFPPLLCTISQCNCQYSEECRNGKNAILHMIDCMANRETHRKPQAGNLFYIISCCCSVMNAAVIHFNTLKSLGICNMFRTRYKSIVQPYLFF